MSEGDAIRLEWFIREYIPGIWVVPISNVCFIPLITSEEYDSIINGVIPKELDAWYFREAIAKYLTNRRKDENVSKEVDQAYLDVKAAWEFIRASKKALEAARENYRLAQGRYQVGVGSIIEVTDAQVQYSQADLTYVQALYDYRTAEARLDKAIGKSF